jgi:D-alanyl-D-alanine carboxypeptidase (penicillin-binding protein 5/6)
VTGRVRSTAAWAALAVACAPATDAAAARVNPPSLRARSAVLVEPTSGDVIMRRAPDAPRPIASATKLMTVLLALERSPLDALVRAPAYRALPAESVLGLRAGERMRVRDLVRAVLLASANDAAVALANHVAGDRAAFVRAMNSRARALGLRHTHYANPIGLDERGNYSSAMDLVALTRVLMRNEFFARTVGLPRATLTSGRRQRAVVNRNVLVGRVPFMVGVKTGHTLDAGYVLVGAGRRRGVTLLSVVLGEPSESARDADTLALMRYGFSRYRVAHPVRRGQVLAHARLRYRDARVPLVARNTIAHVGPRGERLRVDLAAVAEEVSGPLRAGARVGTVLVYARGKVVARTALVTQRAVAAATLAQRLADYLSRTLTLVLLAALLACSLQLALLRRRAGRRGRMRAEHGRETEAT